MTFLTDLATNFTKHGVHFLTYVGNDDGISPHFGTEGEHPHPIRPTPLPNCTQLPSRCAVHQPERTCED